ncbi:MAG: hypothetical protein NTW03_01220 [Verrucomicrobia bacterium]|nr:hypothetical protein [Verrucomicrobiota bacterium]
MAFDHVVTVLEHAKKVLIFVLLGLLVAAPGEVLNQILARANLRAFRSTMISYAVLLLRRHLFRLHHLCGWNRGAELFLREIFQAAGGWAGGAS